LESELVKAEGVEQTVARAQLLVSNLYLFKAGVKSVTVQDWENDGVDIDLVLDPQYGTASAEADALFEKVRKLKRGGIPPGRFGFARKNGECLGNFARSPAGGLGIGNTR
jgi:predicted ribosome quality control (RQC) complex YloA/Tae2 family protein